MRTLLLAECRAAVAMTRRAITTPAPCHPPAALRSSPKNLAISKSLPMNSSAKAVPSQTVRGIPSSRGRWWSSSFSPLPRPETSVPPLLRNFHCRHFDHLNFRSGFYITRATMARRVRRRPTSTKARRLLRRC